jgi:hypothetical protein
MPVPNHDISQSSVSSYTWVFVPDNPAIPPSSGGQTFGATQSYKDIIGTASVKTTNYRRLKSRQLPWNPYARGEIRYRGSLGSYMQEFRQFSYPPGRGLEKYLITANGLSIVTNRVGFPTTEADDPSQQAISRLIKEIGLQKASTGVLLAEAGKTGAHLAHTATRVYNALKALKSARFGTFLSALGVTRTTKNSKTYYTGLKKFHGKNGQGFRYDSKSTFTREQQETRFTDFCARTWLEYSYAWKPLYKDVYDHAEALAKVYIETSGAIRRGIGRAKTKKITNWKQPLNQLAAKRRISSEKFVEYKVEFKIPNGVLSPQTVFGLNNPLTIAWEIVPFSFVVDWFLPIGEALEAMTAYQGLVFHRGYKSFRHVYLHEMNVVAGAPYNTGTHLWTFTGSDVKASYFDMGIDRSILTSFPSFGFPKFKDPRSIAHGISAVALLKTIFLK